MAVTKLSRRKIAAYAAAELTAGRDATAQLAAYLVSTKRTREAELVVRDIEAALADNGVLIADVASSRELDADSKRAVTSYLTRQEGAASVHLRTRVDPTALGGVKISLPGRVIDQTLQARIKKLHQLTVSKQG